MPSWSIRTRWRNILHKRNSAQLGRGLRTWPLWTLLPPPTRQSLVSQSSERPEACGFHPSWPFGLQTSWPPVHKGWRSIAPSPASRSPLEALLRAVSSHLCSSSFTPMMQVNPSRLSSGIRSIVYGRHSSPVPALRPLTSPQLSEFEHEFVEWYDKSALELKAKEMVVTFSSKQRV